MTRSRSKPRRQSWNSITGQHTQPHTKLVRNRNKGNIRLTRSIASLSSSVTLTAVAPGGSGASSSASSLNSCRNCSGFCPIICASCGLPLATCCKMGSSICGCVCTIWRSCWNCGLLRRKSRFAALAAAVPSPVAVDPAAAPVVVVPRLPIVPLRAPPPLPPWLRPACAAASKRLMGASSPPSVVGWASVVAAGVVEVGSVAA